MPSAVEVLQMLIPNGGWTMTGLEYEGIVFLECEPITKKEFIDGFAAYDSWKSKKELERATAKAAIVERLGLTEAELAILLA
jgi:hypothetical protein